MAYLYSSYNKLCRSDQMHVLLVFTKLMWYSQNLKSGLYDRVLYSLYMFEIIHIPDDLGKVCWISIM